MNLISIGALLLLLAPTLAWSDPATFSYKYMPYSEWLNHASGAEFPFDPAPALFSLAHGETAASPPVEKIDPQQYSAQAREFAEVLNARNKNGRAPPKFTGSAAQAWPHAVDGTYVVEIKTDTVIPRRLGEIDLSPAHVAELAEAIDTDHADFLIPGSFVEQALTAGDAGFTTIRPNKRYLLTVVDFRKYNCDVMKSAIDDYFSHSPTSEPLHNDSIYLISDLAVNRPDDLARAGRYFGHRVDALVVQRIVYADHVLHGGETIFAFFSEGDRTRVAMISDLGMKSKFFTGAKGLVLRQYILDGITGGALGSVTGHVLEAKDALSNLLAGAEQDVQSRNSCNRGLALGLIRYSQSLFSQFIAHLEREDSVSNER